MRRSAVDHIGIDLHKRESQICIVSDDGDLIERAIHTTRDRFAAVLGDRPRARILLEASTESEWVAQCLETLGHEVIVGDPNYAPMYPERRRRVKTNRRDARTLATACRLGAYRPAHRVSAEQRRVRQQLTVRDVLVRSRTRAIAMTGALVRGEGLRVRRGAPEQFLTRLGAVPLPPALHATLAATRALLTTLDAEIRHADAAVEQIALHDPAVARLISAPGIGPVTAAAFVATLDRADRFAGAHQVESYLGLVPSEDSSADARRRGHITKAGNPRMRWLLVQAAWAVWHSTQRDAQPLRAWAQRIAHRRGRSVAVVALARRLAGILFAMWRDETPFDGTRLARRARILA
jgi:transposase